MLIALSADASPWQASAAIRRAALMTFRGMGTKDYGAAAGHAFPLINE